MLRKLLIEINVVLKIVQNVINNVLLLRNLRIDNYNLYVYYVLKTTDFEFWFQCFVFNSEHLLIYLNEYCMNEYQH